LIGDEKTTSKADAKGDFGNLCNTKKKKQRHQAEKWWLKPISHRIKDRRFLRIEEEVALN
jgi:hypothetical protein